MFHTVWYWFCIASKLFKERSWRWGVWWPWRLGQGCATKAACLSFGAPWGPCLFIFGIQGWKARRRKPKAKQRAKPRLSPRSVPHVCASRFLTWTCCDIYLQIMISKTWTLRPWIHSTWGCPGGWHFHQSSSWGFSVCLSSSWLVQTTFFGTDVPMYWSKLACGFWSFRRCPLKVSKWHVLSSFPGRSGDDSPVSHSAVALYASEITSAQYQRNWSLLFVVTWLRWPKALVEPWNHSDQNCRKHDKAPASRGDGFQCCVRLPAQVIKELLTLNSP